MLSPIQTSLRWDHYRCLHSTAEGTAQRACQAEAGLESLLKREAADQTAPCCSPASGAKHSGAGTATADSGSPLQKMPTSCLQCERPERRVAHQVQSLSVTSPLRRNPFMLIKATGKSDSVRWHSWIPQCSGRAGTHRAQAGRLGVQAFRKRNKMCHFRLDKLNIAN